MTQTKIVLWTESDKKSMSVLNIKQSYRIYNYTGLPRKDETLVNHQNIPLNSETKRQASNRHNSRVLGRLYSLILCGYPSVYVCNLLLVKSKHLERCDLSCGLFLQVLTGVDRSWPNVEKDSPNFRNKRCNRNNVFTPGNKG